MEVCPPMKHASRRVAAHVSHAVHSLTGSLRKARSRQVLERGPGRRSALAIVALMAVAFYSVGSGLINQAPTGTWAPAADMSSARSGASTVLLHDGRLLVAGGDAGNGALASAEIFDTSGNFVPAPPMNFKRSKHSATLLQDGRVLVAGGTGDGGTATDTAEIYDASADTWTVTGGRLSLGRSGHTASLLKDGKVLLAGGDSDAVA